jgi:hypothetical protein
MLIIGVCIMGLGVFRYQQVATLAREGARYASVHGYQYAQDTGKSAATAADVFNNAIVPMAVGLNTSNAYLTYSVTWTKTTPSGPPPTYYNPNSTPPGEPIDNYVTVTVTYKWVPEAYVAGPINLTSTSVMPMSY